MAWDIASTVLNRSAERPTSGKPNSGSQYQLFRRSRLRLATWYAGVMGTILTLLGLGVYRAIAHAHEVTLDREVKSVADAIHDAIEADLNVSNPSQLDRVPSQLLPDLCLPNEPCTEPATRPSNGLHARLQQPSQYDYYIRIVDPTGALLATAGIRPEGLFVSPPLPIWQSLTDSSGEEYHQIALPLDADSQGIWAYLLVGRSFQDFDRYLASVRWSLLIGLLLASGSNGCKLVACGFSHATDLSVIQSNSTVYG